LVHLTSLPNLTELLLDSATITDSGTATLAAFTQLKVINLYHTLVTDKGMEALRKSLSGCRIVWERDSAQPIRRGS
jgi:hypothetical protein